MAHRELFAGGATQLSRAGSGRVSRAESGKNRVESVNNGYANASRRAPEFHHHVYVVLLDDGAMKHRSIMRSNPRRQQGKPCVYVGMSGLAPEERFENHRLGYKSAWVVRKYGLRLMPELYAHLNPMPYEAAVQMERDLAEDLRNEGYTVTGGH